MAKRRCLGAQAVSIRISSSEERVKMTSTERSRKRRNKIYKDKRKHEECKKKDRERKKEAAINEFYDRLTNDTRKEEYRRKQREKETIPKVNQSTEKFFLFILLEHTPKKRDESQDPSSAKKERQGTLQTGKSVDCNINTN